MMSDVSMYIDCFSVLFLFVCRNKQFHHIKTYVRALFLAISQYVVITKAKKEKEGGKKESNGVRCICRHDEGVMATSNLMRKGEHACII